MSGTWEDVEARKEQARIDANRVFIQCLKKMAKIAYGKMEVKPHPDEPLKRTIGIYKTPLYNIRIACALREIHKRYNSSPNDRFARYQFEPLVRIGLEIQQGHGLILEKLTMHNITNLGHISCRSPKIFLRKIAELITGIDKQIVTEDSSRTEEIKIINKKDQVFNEIKGLIKDSTREHHGNIGTHKVGRYSHDSVSMTVNGELNINTTVTVKQLNAITKYLGWR